jgi:hypothetical protein
MKEGGCKITLNSRSSSKTKKKGSYSKFEDSNSLSNMRKGVWKKLEDLKSVSKMKKACKSLKDLKI